MPADHAEYRLAPKARNENSRQPLASGETRAALATAGTPIGSCDDLFSGQAKARDPVVVNNNTSEFHRVTDLRADWMERGRGRLLQC